ncbi:MAG: SpoIIE family protein phosphatase [Bacteroidales bacterium]|nr:SpoIIE family protein phosphatase [Bacteroidales bacterium]
MKKLGLVTKLAIVTTAVVAVIFTLAMFLLYTGSKKNILNLEIDDAKTDLSHTAEMLFLLKNTGLSFEQLELYAETPWSDGSCQNIYDLVQADSVAAVERRIKEEEPDAIILKSTIYDDDARYVLLEKFILSEHLLPVHDAMKQIVHLAFIILILMGLFIFLVIKYQLRPELERTTRIDTELEIARNLQDKMLPSLESLKGELDTLEVGGLMKPAKEIGGDYYNVLKVGDELHFIIADVSGKGIPAAMFMVRLSELYLLDLTGSSKREPNRIAEDLNNRLCVGNAACMFVTAILGRLNVRTGRLELCSAGHEPPLVVSEEGEASFLTLDNDVPIGLVKDSPYKLYTTYLKGNSHLLLYTDGVTEAENEKLEFFGSGRLSQMMKGQGENSAEQVIDIITKEVREFTGTRPQNDDITLLDIKLLSASENSPHTTKLELANDLSELTKLLEMAESMGISGNATLAMEEAFVNVVNYSHADLITVEVDQCPESLTLKITDNGIPFDPTLHRREEESPLDENGFLKVGGEGINLMMNLAREVAYQRIGDNNVLTIIANI